MSNHLRPDLEQLFQQARAGDGTALGQLLESYRSYLALLARLQIGRWLQSKVDAEELVQETFLEASRDFPRFQGTTEAEWVGWLRQVLATNLADLVRRFRGTRRRDIRLERQLADELDQSSRVLDGALVAKQSSPSQQAVRHEQAVLLANMLGQLPEAYREVLILHQLQDLGFPEVARQMGRSVDSVKNLWLRALDRLRRLLGVAG
jgi:RNA polymerase sigma-70 factor (ECF subfamily)